MNRSWSFGDRPKPHVRIEFTGYLTVQAFGFLVNYAVYLGLVTGYLGVDVAPVLALAVGAAVSAALTFMWC
jgi:hypothetical protein